MRILLMGASGHGKVVADIVRETGTFDIVGFVDDDPAKSGATTAGIPILGGEPVLPGLLEQGVLGAIVTIGDNETRIACARRLVDSGFDLVAVVHPAAVVAPDVAPGAGSVIMAGAVLNAGTNVGENVIVNTGATVDHDCVLGDGSHVSPGANLAGGVRVNRLAHVGIGSCVVPGVEIGERSVVGAGAVVVDDVPENETWAGNPARLLYRGDSEHG